jgi:DNA-binding transcriptional regulator LsrR (DeoR family)
MMADNKNDDPLLTRQQQALALHRRGWTRRRIAGELGIGLPAVSRLLGRAMHSDGSVSPTKIPRRPKPQRIRPLSLAHYV